MNSIFVTKILTCFSSPLGTAFLIGFAAISFSFTKWRHLGQVLLGLMLISLWISSTPLFAKWLNVQVASLVPTDKLETVEKSDAIILLCGTPISRVVRALMLYQAGKAPRIVVTGGNLPWEKRPVPEAERVAELLVVLGVPRSALVLESKSQSTRENAVNTAAIFRKHGWKNGLIVTSITHMPRALSAFENAGLNVAPATWVLVSPRSIKAESIFDLLPNAEALALTTGAVKEILGLKFYQIRGWV
jgi:uncharacterized SAM-binding protein YcdF (DUF218 family)